MEELAALRLPLGGHLAVASAQPTLPLLFLPLLVRAALTTVTSLRILRHNMAQVQRWRAATYVLAAAAVPAVGARSRWRLRRQPHRRRQRSAP